MGGWLKALVFVIALSVFAAGLGFYKFGLVRLADLGLGLSVALPLTLAERGVRLLAPGLGPPLVWGGLAGGAAWGLLTWLLAPFSGLVWPILSQSLQAGLFLCCALAASLVFLRLGPPRLGPRKGQPEAGAKKTALAGMALAGLLGFFALLLSVAAGEIEAGAGGSGLKGLLKDPRFSLAGMALLTLALSWTAYLRPWSLLAVWLPALGCGLLWARFALAVVSPMAPIVALYSGEMLQAVFAAGFCWLAASLVRSSPPGAR